MISWHQASGTSGFSNRSLCIPASDLPRHITRLGVIFVLCTGFVYIRGKDFAITAPANVLVCNIAAKPTTNTELIIKLNVHYGVFSTIEVPSSTGDFQLHLLTTPLGMTTKISLYNAESLGLLSFTSWENGSTSVLSIWEGRGQVQARNSIQQTCGRFPKGHIPINF